MGCPAFAGPFEFANDGRPGGIGDIKDQQPGRAMAAIEPVAMGDAVMKLGDGAIGARGLLGLAAG